MQNETTTGVTSDIGGCRKAMDAANHPSLLLVDGVSSIGALEFKMDEWRVDVAVTGSQKALSLPTGLALVAASNKVSRQSLVESRFAVEVEVDSNCKGRWYVQEMLVQRLLTR